MLKYRQENPKMGVAQNARAPLRAPRRVVGKNVNLQNPSQNTWSTERLFVFGWSRDRAWSDRDLPVSDFFLENGLESARGCFTTRREAFSEAPGRENVAFGASDTPPIREQ